MKPSARRAAACAPVLLALLLAGCASPGLNRKAGEFDLGPLASRLTDPAGGTHLKVAGPLYERASDTNGLSFWAVRPLTSGGGENADRRAGEVLWPLAYSWDFQNSHSVRVLTSFYTDYDTTNPNARWQWWCFPFWFQGRTAGGTNYAAFFPIGGTVRDFLFQDKSFFVLWPLYIHNVLKGEHSYHVLYPVFCRENNARNDRFRLWPLYGWNIRRGEFDKRFCLWPLVSWARYESPGGTGYGYLVFPLYGHIKRENQESWMVLPPFFKYATSAKETMGYAPWPIIQWQTGDLEKFYVWPLWGYKNYGHIHGGFYLWPLGWWRHFERPGEQLHRYTFAPFWMSESEWGPGKPAQTVMSERAREPLPPLKMAEANAAVTNCAYRYWHFWPLCEYLRQGDQSRFRLLKLWPKRYGSMIEREFAPLWTLYQRQHAGQNSSDELLWGLVRRSSRGEEQSRFSLFPIVEWGHDDKEQNGGWNLLKGLVGYEHEGTNSYLRLLWFLKLGL
jgi:hypothetical protein